MRSKNEQNKTYNSKINNLIWNINKTRASDKPVLPYGSTDLSNYHFRPIYKLFCSFRDTPKDRLLIDIDSHQIDLPNCHMNAVGRPPFRKNVVFSVV